MRKMIKHPHCIANHTRVFFGYEMKGFSDLKTLYITKMILEFLGKHKINFAYVNKKYEGYMKLKYQTRLLFALLLRNPL